MEGLSATVRQWISFQSASPRPSTRRTPFRSPCASTTLRPERFASNDLTWLDNEVFDEGSKIKIEMGYRDNRAVKLYGHITGMNASFPESGAPTLTVRGQSHYTTNCIENDARKPFDPKRTATLRRAIARDLGLEARRRRDDVEHPLVSPEGATYAAILQERAKRLNYEIAIKDDKLIFKRPTYLVEDRAPCSDPHLGRKTCAALPPPSHRQYGRPGRGQKHPDRAGGGKAALAGTMPRPRRYTCSAGRDKRPGNQQEELWGKHCALR